MEGQLLRSHCTLPPLLSVPHPGLRVDARVQIVFELHVPEPVPLVPASVLQGLPRDIRHAARLLVLTDVIVTPDRRAAPPCYDALRRVETGGLRLRPLQQC